jgi:hypothetical protein
MKKIKPILTLITLFSLSVFLMQACSSSNTISTIVGQVTDKSGSPLDGVEINYNGEAIKTKSDGHFTWIPSDSTARKIQLAFSKIGYKPETITINAKQANTKPLNIKLISNGDPLAAYEITKVNIEPEVLAIMAEKWGNEFKHAEYPIQYLDNIITLKPGDNIQNAIDKVSSEGGGVVFLTEGTFETDNLKTKSKVTLSGVSRAKTIVKHIGNGNFFDQQKGEKLSDFVLKDITFQGGSETDCGFHLHGDNSDRHERFMWQNVTFKDFGHSGIAISRVNHVIMDNSLFQHAGAKGGLHHNVYFLFVGHVLQSDCDMSYPTEGKSNKYTSTKYLLTQRCVMKDGKGNGIQADNDQGGYLFFHKHHLSGFKRVAMWFPCEEYYNKFEYTEDTKWVPQNVILNRCEVVDNTWGAMWRVVKGNSFVMNSHFDNEKIDIGLLKCNVKMENSTFKTGYEEYTDVQQWPGDVKLLW